MKEYTITTNRMNHLIDPSLQIWGWEVPVYLFLGGVAAGILLISALVILSGKRTSFPFASDKLPIYGPIILSLGMFILFLDLEFKLHVFRFYTTFKVTSPMSWGSWILIFYYPFSLALFLGTIKKGYPSLHNWVIGLKVPLYSTIQKICEEKTRTIAALSIPVGLTLGIYTGILLSAFAARPFWNSALLGPIFLVSGLSTALALTILLTKDKREQQLFSKLDMIAIGFELLGIFLLIVGMNIGGNLIKQEAIGLLLGGSLTTQFWVFVIFIGLLIPLLLETLEIYKFHIPYWISPCLVLVGGLMFRFVMVSAGQLSTWLPY